jgi:hypothetical protein
MTPELPDSISRRRLLGGAAATLGVAAAGGLDACTRYHPPQATGQAGSSPSPRSTSAGLLSAGPAGAPLPVIPANYNVKARRPQPTPGKIQLGAFLQLQNMTTQQALTLRYAQTGRKLATQQWFYEFPDDFSTTYHTSEDATLCYAWYGTSYASILSGRYDSRFALNAKRLASYGHPMFMRFAWEMNGNWYAHGGARNGKNPANFVKVWRHIYEIFQNNGADNVGWMWSPYFKSAPSDPWNDISNYYPGDEYVDWVGVSAYFRRSQDTPEELFDGIYRTYAARKPIIIAETGIAAMDPAVMVGRLQTFSDYIQQRPGIASILWFDSDRHIDSAGAQVDLRIDINPQMAAAYRTMAQLPIFNT